MSLYRRPGSPHWWTLYYVGGIRTRRSTGETSRARANAVEARFREQARDRAQGVGRTWDDAALRWLDEHDTKRSLWKDEEYLRWLAPHLTGARLETLTRARLEEVREAKRRETSRVTANRTMSLVRSIMRAAERWEWIARAPAVAMFPVEPGEPRWITFEQFEKLCSKLPAHTVPIARFAVATGLRKANILGLRWADVDLARAHVTIPSSAAKGKRPIAVPLNADAMAVLLGCCGQHPTRVFTYDGQPIGQISTRAWREACKRAGLPGLRVHDLRHTWASWHVQAGTSLVELQALGGWRSFQMVLRYAHLSSASLRAAAARIEQPQAQPQQKVPNGSTG